MNTQNKVAANLYQSIKAEKEKKYTQLLNDCKVFWAFSNEQFAENKTELNEGEKYVSMGAGGYMPKSFVQSYLDGSKAIDKWYKAAVKDSKTKEAQILYALRNHECFYTGDWTDAFYTLGDAASNEEVKEVYLKHRELENQY